MNESIFPCLATRYDYAIGFYLVLMSIWVMGEIAFKIDQRLCERKRLYDEREDRA